MRTPYRWRPWKQARIVQRAYERECQESETLRRRNKDLLARALRAEIQVQAARDMANRMRLIGGGPALNFATILLDTLDNAHGQKNRRAASQSGSNPTSYRTTSLSRGPDIMGPRGGPRIHPDKPDDEFDSGVRP